MADGIYFNVSALNDLNIKIQNISQKMKDNAVMEFNASALKIESDAKRNAPVNLGTLRNSIHLTEKLEDGKIIYTIGTPVSYAPYVEFGTGGKVSIPSGYEAFASQFKGKGKAGTLEEFMMALAQWIKRKGIKTGVYNIKTKRREGGKGAKQLDDIKLAYAILFSILKKGIKAQPFLIPAYESELPNLKKRLKEVINNAQS